MKVQVEKGTLIQVLQRLQNITDKKTSMPILSNALIKVAEDGIMKLSATDLDLSLRTSITVQVESPGGTTISARKLLEIVRELPYEQITLEGLPNGKLQIRAGRSRFELSTISTEDFPYLIDYDDIECFPCNAASLRSLIGKTLYGVPPEEDSFSIAGLFWHTVESGAHRFVSSDGHRLAYYEVPPETFPGIDIGTGIVIPRKGAQEILRLIEKEEEVSLSVHESFMIVKTPDSVLSVKLLDAEFPEYRLIIPEERPNAFTIDRETFHHALRRVATLTNTKWRYVRLLVSDGSLELEAGNPELGNANDLLDIDYSGEPFSVAFNIRYIMDTVQAIESSGVCFEWVDEYHGGVFVGDNDPGYLSLIMPMVV